MVKLNDFSTLTFDCYATLIDCQSGIFAALQHLLARVHGRLAVDALAYLKRHSKLVIISNVDRLHTAQSRGSAPDPAKGDAFGNHYFSKRWG